MSIGNRESHPVMKKSSRGGQEGLAKNHRSNGCGPNEPVAVIKSLGTTTDWAGEETLMIPGSFTVAIQPIGKVRQYAG